MGAFNADQTAYIKQEVEQVAGFKFVTSNPVDSPPKMFLQYVNPAGTQHNQNTPVGKNHDWLTDDAQFKAVVADAVQVMAKDV